MVSAIIHWLEQNETMSNSVRTVDLGASADVPSAPNARCLLTLDDAPALCVRLFKNSCEAYSFRQAEYWQDLLIVGWGHAVYVVASSSLAVTRHDLGAYFGCFHTEGDALLVASAENVVRLDNEGAVIWKSDPVAIDGVTLSNVNGEFVEGSGEWDPPGEWKPFRLRFADGQIVVGGETD